MNKLLLNHGWSFSLDGSETKPVRIPHDWLIGDAHNHYKSGTGKYTRSLNIEPDTAGKLISLRFDGVYMDSTLLINGQYAGEWKYGYTTFEFDITSFVIEGKNKIELTVNYDGQSARWYTGAGIYRDVWLITRNACHFAPDGIYVSTSQADGKWSWDVDAEVVTEGKEYQTRHKLLDAPKDGVSPSGLLTQSLDTKDIIPWDIDNPQLYTVRSELIVDGKVTDTVDTLIGFRAIQFDKDKGFFLNGKPLKIFGVCQHHDLGSLGAAFYKDAAGRQLDILRKMGVNAIRTAHNPPAPGLLELCDEMGFLVMNELTDIWRRSKTPGDYSRFFDEWSERDVASWIRRDRNRPCIIMWSVGNEIYDTHADATDGSATLRRLLELVRKHDPNGNAPATLCSNYMAWENTQKCIQDNIEMMQIVGYNYAENLYHDHHERYPGWIIYGSETSSTLQSRGVYHFPLSRPVLADDDLQCSSLGNTTTSWGAKNTEACIRDDFKAPFSLGQFLWSGIDYLGEPTPYHTKNCYFGQADTAGFEKDSYYVYKAAWTDYKTNPFVHMFPYWDFSPGQLIDVRVCSNAPRIALYFNNKKIGDEDLNIQYGKDGRRINKHEEKWIASWQIPYEEGILRAEAFDETGAVIAVTQRVSFGDAVSLQTQTDTYGELDFVTVTAHDDIGRTVENANCRAVVSVENGELLTLDNGDSADYDSYHDNSRRLFSGKLLAIVKRTGKGNPKVTAEICDKDVPIRKIELERNCDNPYDIRAKVYPPNATYKDLTWRLTDAGGIDSPMGELKVSDDGLGAVILPKGDGTGYIRCSANNGKEHPALISMLEFEVSGMGMPYLNPYEFLSAGLYNACNAEPGSGIDRGVATRRLDETHVGFKNIDFGNFGSDEITLWLFPMGGDPFDFEIWEDMPDDKGELVYTAYYDKGSVWNTYIEVTYKLPRRFKGITTLCLVFRDKVHIKGFQFKKPDKAYSKLYAAEHDHIYGDSFKISGNCVEGIGNNVSILFKDMDFGEKGARNITLCTRSMQEKNSMRMDYETPDGEIITRMLTLDGNSEYTQQAFPLDTVLTGKGKITLVFLPGSNLDLEFLIFNE